MCLHIVGLQDDLRFNEHGYIVAYKVLSRRYGTSCSKPDEQTYKPKGKLRYPGLISPVFTFVWKCGWNDSGRKCKYLTKSEKIYHRVNRGIHVLLRKNEALRYVDYSDGEVIVKVRCYKKDFVACGTGSDGKMNAVFRRVYLPKEEWLRARGIKPKSSVKV